MLFDLFIIDYVEELVWITDLLINVIIPPSDSDAEELELLTSPSLFI